MMLIVNEDDPFNRDDLVQEYNRQTREFLGLFIRSQTIFFKYDFVIRQIDEHDSGWHYSEELRLIESSFNSFLADSAARFSLSLSPLTGQQDQAFDTTAILYRSYTLTHIIDITDYSADTTEYLGTSIFTMIENQQGLWSIIRWEDQHQHTNIPSWADYKNGYR